MNNHKYIFIDESGSNNIIFVICLIIFDNLTKISEVEGKINKFKLNLFKNIDIELHFNKEGLNTKRLFFKLWRKKDFTIKHCKSNNNLTFSEQIIDAVLKHRDVTNDSTIYIDGFRSRCYNRKILSEIKKGIKKYNLNIKSIKYIDSKNSNLIQLADMCAGCIRRKFERNRKEDNELFDLIKIFM